MPQNNRRPLSWPWCQSVAMRDPAASNRACTPLELLFDLCFVVSVAVLVVQLHHELVDGVVVHAAMTYVLLFLPICWAWMLFSWFATSYDNDDVIYRLLTLGQMSGVLALTATIPRAFDGDLAPFAVGYVLMRVPLIVKWIRSARSGAGERGYAVRYATGLTACQGGWLLILLVPSASQPMVLVSVLAVELLVPPWAMRAARRQVFHAQHLTERFGLFTIIVIGESVLAATIALQGAFDGPGLGSMVTIGASTLVSAFCVWWLYFDVLDGRSITLDASRALRWGHGHLLAFCAIGAMGAAAEVAIQVQAESLPFGIPLRVAVVVPAVVTVLALTGVHAVTKRDARFHTAGRVLAAVTIAVVGTAVGEYGPAATTVSIAAVLLLLAVGETASQGLSMRRIAATIVGPLPLLEL